jgi:hypothetical protein
MVNKLRVLMGLASLFLLATSAWMTLRYDVPGVLTTSAISVVVIVGLPVVLAYAKIGGRRTWRSIRNRVGEGLPDRETTLVSDSPVEDPTSVLTAIADAVRDADEFDGVRRESFEDDDDGLMVTHAGFHGSFVRITDGDHLAITGSSKRTRSLASLVESIRPLSLTDRANNPFHGPIPVRGAPRVFLGLFLIAIVVIASGSMANAAYPSNSYTAAEKAILVGFDARADFDGGVSPTDARLDKADFIADSVGEEAVEVNWTRANNTWQVEKHARQSLAMSADARALLESVRNSDPTPEQAARADRIEAEVREGEAAVADEITRRIEKGEIERTDALAASLERLRADAEGGG